MLKLQYFGYLIWRSNSGKDWEQEESEVTEDEMVGWHRWLNGPKFEQTLGDSEGQGSLACCSPCGHKELDMTEWLNATVITEAYQNRSNQNRSIKASVSYICEFSGHVSCICEFSGPWWGEILFVATGLPQQFLTLVATTVYHLVIPLFSVLVSY